MLSSQQYQQQQQHQQRRQQQLFAPAIKKQSSHANFASGKKFSPGTSTPIFFRKIPLQPNSRKTICIDESDSAKTVRLLLERHKQIQQQKQQQQQQQQQNQTNNNNNNLGWPPRPRNIINKSKVMMLNTPSDPPSQYSSALTSNGENNVIIDIEVEDKVNNDDEEILHELRKGQSRIREIKSLLLDQRDKLTRLKQEMEERLSAKVLQMSENSNNVPEDESKPPPRICPMCELEFCRSSTSEEEFETHVLDHFVYLDEDQGDLETMMYIGGEGEEEEVFEREAEGDEESNSSIGK